VLLIDEKEELKATLSDRTLNQTDRNHIIYSLDQIVQPKREEWIVENKNDEIHTSRANGQPSFLQTRTNSD